MSPSSTPPLVLRPSTGGRSATGRRRRRPTERSPVRSADAAELLDLIRARHRTRAELADLTGHSRATIGLRLEPLISRGLVLADRTGVPGRGRPAALLRFNAAAALVYGAVTRFALLDLAGTVIAQAVEPVDVAAGPTQVLDLLDERCETLLASVGRRREAVRAGCVGIPRRVEFPGGTLPQPHAMPGWDGFPLAEALGERLRIPMLVDNEVNLMALGEHAAAWPSVSNLVFVTVGDGVRAGIIIRGELYRGAQGSAGDIGHIAVPGYEDLACICGNHGCLSSVAGGASLAQQLTAHGVDAAGTDAFVTWARAGQPDAIRLARDAGRAIGQVLAATVNTLNPSVLVIGGALAEVGEPLLAGIRQEIYGRATTFATLPLQIVASRAGAQAGVLGAGAVATERALSRDAIERLLAA